MKFFSNYGLMHMAVNISITCSLLASQSPQISLKGEQLINAIIQKDNETIHQLISHYPVINYRNRYGMTPLHYAASRGHVSIVKLLIVKEALINAKDLDGDTPLATAARNDHKEVADLLIAKGGHITIHIAATLGYTAHLKSMLQSGIPVDIRDSYNQTPLHYAAKKCHPDAVKVLIECAADVNAKNKYHWTPLHYACESGCEHCAKLLIENGANVNAETMIWVPFAPSFSPLHLVVHNAKLGETDSPAILASKSKIVDLLISSNADVNLVNSDGQTPLHEAAHKGYTDIMIKLIKRGANINAKDIRNDTPFDIANPDAKQLLLKHGGKRGIDLIETKFYNAVRSGDCPTVQRLIDGHSVDVNKAIHTDSQTPLHMASQKGYTNLIQLLLDSGADVNKPDQNGNTALIHATINGQIEAVQLLLVNGADPDLKAKVRGEEAAALHFSAFWADYDGQIEIAGLLLKYGADVNARDSNKNTPLHLSAYKGRKELVQLLLNNGADVNALSKPGLTALDYNRGFLEIEEMLKKAGAKYSKDLKVSEAKGTVP